MAPISTATHAPQINGFNGAEKDEKLLILDDLIRARAQDKVQTPLLYFPETERGVTDYEPFTGRDLDRMIDQAAKYYMRCGLEPVGTKTIVFDKNKAYVNAGPTKGSLPTGPH